MLYLVRKLGESIIINGNIEIKLIEVKGKSAKLGFEFPATAQVLRKEIHDRIVAENLAAQMSHPEDNHDDITEAMSGIDLTKVGSGDEDSGSSDGKKEDKKE